MIKTKIIFSLFFGFILLSSSVAVGYSQSGTSPDWAEKEGSIGLGYTDKSYLAAKEKLEKEKTQLDKEERVIIQELELLRIQMFDLSLTIDQFKNNDVSSDKIEDLEDQLSELEFDKSDLEDSQVYLQERKDAYEKNWSELQEVSSIFEKSFVNPITEQKTIPPWFKSNAKWWKQGLISDGDIVNALETLIIQDVIPLDNFIEVDLSPAPDHYMPNDKLKVDLSPAPDHYMPNDKLKVDLSPAPDYYIPSYQKDVFSYWSEGLVSDTEILNSIGYLMIEGIINSEKIKTEIAEKNVYKDALPPFYESNQQFDKNDPKVTTNQLIPFDVSEPRYDYGTLEETQVGSGGTELGDGGVDIDIVTKSGDGTTTPSSYFSNDSLVGYQIEIVGCSQSDCSDSVKISEPVEPVEGGMQQMTPVTVLTIGGIQFPISQFSLWKWEGECNNEWHYHTNSGHAYSLDGITGISDPDQENCGFGTVSQLPASTGWMLPYEISNFEQVTSFDPLISEAMVLGVAVPIQSWTPYNGPTLGNNGITKSAYSDIEFDDADGDGIEDGADPEPNTKNNEFGGVDSENKALNGKIIDRGDLTVTVSHSAEGTVSIEVGTDGDSEFVVVEIMGVELELEAGTIIEAQFQ